MTGAPRCGKYSPAMPDNISEQLATIIRQQEKILLLLKKNKPRTKVVVTKKRK